MLVLSDRTSLRNYVSENRCQGRSIGFVPTMGALHQGHISLIEKAKQQNQVVVCSIFVNPTQFNNADDFTHYPKTLEHDRQLLEAAGCDAVFIPEVELMYPEASVLRFSFGALEEVMEGAHRPGHFNGVATIVSKLFHLVQPHRAYFGQKDLQQFAIIRQLVQDLSFDLELVCCPIVREADGLAMSSRNVRLPEQERQVAPELYRALQKGAHLLPHRPATEVRQAVLQHLAQFPLIKPEYVELAHAHTLQPVQQPNDKTPLALCLAAHLGPVRLIDNVVI